MSNLISIPLKAPPTTTNVKVDFYDSEEMALFAASPMREYVNDLPQTLALSTVDLLAYYLYYKKKPGVPGYSTHEEVARHWADALFEFEGQLEFTASSLRVIQNARLDTGTTERLGEAFGLSVASKLHGLHQADWDRIPESNRSKTLDFQRPHLASDGRQFIQVEAKGSASVNNDLKPPSISKHKASIKAKKAEVPKATRHLSVLYGTISVVDNRQNSTAKCWLVDPPAEIPGDPIRFKIVNRLKYIGALISLISPRSVLAATLQTRLSALESLENIQVLDGKPLLKGDGRTFATETFLDRRRHNSFFTGRSVVTSEAIGGVIYFVDKERFLFIGLQEDLVALAIAQSFDKIQEYAYQEKTIERSVDCVIPKGRFTQSFRPYLKIPLSGLAKDTGYARFKMIGQLHCTQAGLVFGVLPTPKEWQQ
jgi:hypothetical protein